MLTKKVFTLFILFIACAAFAVAQTVDEIVAKHVEALGGLDKINAIKSVKITGTITRGGGQRSFESTFTRYIKMPNMVRSEMDMRGNLIIQAYDGKTAWGIMPFGGSDAPQEMEAPPENAIQQQLNIGGPLVNYKSKGFKVELIGKEDFEGTQVYKLKVTGENGDTFFSYLDAEYYLEIKRVTKRTTPDGGENEVTTLFSDFKPVNGVMMAHSISGGAGMFMFGGFRGRRGGGGRGAGRGGFGGRSNVTILSKIEVNIEIDDSLFQIPKK